MIKHCRAILFDFGGTLDSDGGHWLDRIYQLYRLYCPDISLAEVKRVFYAADDYCIRSSAVNAMGLRALMAFHIGLQHRWLGIEDRQVQRRMTDHFCVETEHCLKHNAFLLNQLKQVYQVGVLSNFYGNLITICQEYHLAELFDVILDSMREGVSKPDATFFQKALQGFHLDGGQVMMVGDSFEKDIFPAKKLGMTTVWLKGTYPHIPKEIERPERYIDKTIIHLTDLKRLLL